MEKGCGDAWSWQGIGFGAGFWQPKRGKNMDKPWKNHGITMEKTWKTMEKLWKNYGKNYGKNHGKPTNLPKKRRNYVEILGYSCLAN